MTDVQAMELGRRWLAAGGGWREGMRDGDGYVVWTFWMDAWPDLRDPATKGAALEVVRERWGDPLATLALFAHDPPRWCVVNGKNNAQVFHHAGTEAEALVAALEAAGGRS